MARMLTLLCLVLSPALGRAQDHPEPQPRPAPRAIAPAGSAPPGRATSIPGLEDTDFRLRPAPLRREGSFILRQRGSMIRLPGGERAFVFHRDAQGRAERPMVLLPCLMLQGMEQIARERGADTAFLLTGQVYAYHGVNYLLPTASPVVGTNSPEHEPTPKPESPPQPPPEPERPASPPADPAVQDLIRGLEQQRHRPRTLGAPPSAPAPPAPAAESRDLLAEGSALSRRRGRLVRLSNGEWAFAMDNAPADQTAGDRVIVLSPCLNLERLEYWEAQVGDGATLLLSGRIYQYQGRNHLIPTMHQVVTAGELSPRQ